eukprot:gene3668-4578_t
MTRLVVDNQAYTEGSVSFGTTTWNPQAGTLTSFANIVLPAGTHSVKLQWKRLGSVFQGWVSSPSILDGFASSRNFIVLVDRYNDLVYQNHARVALDTTPAFQTISNKITFSLFKESAVLFTYSLPVTQLGNPNLDANSWAELSNLETRLVVDTVSYIYSGSTISGLSRTMDTARGELALILPAGYHTVALQWKSLTVNWTSLNNLNDGYVEGEQLLGFILAQDYAPTVSASPANYTGTENEPLSISGVFVADVDTAISPGMTVAVNLSVANGRLSFSAVPLNARHYSYFRVVNSSSLTVTDTIDIVNAMLGHLLYSPTLHWSGTDNLRVSMSDLGNVGPGGPLTAALSVTIVIAPVNNPSSIVFGPAVHVTAGIPSIVGPYLLEDPDEPTAEFRVQLACYCGYLSVPLDLIPHFSFYEGTGVQDAVVDFSGVLIDVQAALRNVTYISRSGCNRFLHSEYVSINVTDVARDVFFLSQHNEIIVVGNGSSPTWSLMPLPRFSLTSGIASTDPSHAEVYTYTQYPSRYSAKVTLAELGNGVVSSYSEDGQVSQLAVLTKNSSAYVVGVRFGNAAPFLTDTVYAPFDALFEATVQVSDADLQLLVNTSLLCDIDAILFPAALVRDRVHCNISYASTSLSPNQALHWLRAYSRDTTWSSDFQPIIFSDQPYILSIAPSRCYRSHCVTVSVRAANLQPVDT